MPYNDPIHDPTAEVYAYRAAYWCPTCAAYDAARRHAPHLVDQDDAGELTHATAAAVIQEACQDVEQDSNVRPFPVSRYRIEAEPYEECGNCRLPLFDREYIGVLIDEYSGAYQAARLADEISGDTTPWRDARTGQVFAADILADLNDEFSDGHRDAFQEVINNAHAEQDGRYYTLATNYDGAVIVLAEVPEREVPEGAHADVTEVYVYGEHVARVDLEALPHRFLTAWSDDAREAQGEDHLDTVERGLPLAALVNTLNTLAGPGQDKIRRVYAPWHTQQHAELW